MQIIFISPPVLPPDGVITGGTKLIFRMAETLRRLGYDAVVYEQSKARPSWFASDTPVVGPETVRKSADQILVIPEDQVHVMEQVASWPQRKVVFCQSFFYAAFGLKKGATYDDFGVSHILCAGRANYDHCRHRHPKVSAFRVPISVDPARFFPRKKREMIACIPRKRTLELPYLRDLFQFEYPKFRDIEWLEMKDKSEQEIATVLGEASVFLALHRLDSLPLTGIEALASGCVVAGFTGIGGREYATAKNGFWADEDDFPACIRQLAKAVRLSRESSARRKAYAAACARTAASYSPAVFEDAVGKAWAAILKT